MLFLVLFRSSSAKIDCYSEREGFAIFTLMASLFCFRLTFFSLHSLAYLIVEFSKLVSVFGQSLEFQICDGFVFPRKLQA